MEGNVTRDRGGENAPGGAATKKIRHKRMKNKRHDGDDDEEEKKDIEPRKQLCVSLDDREKEAFAAAAAQAIGQTDVDLLFERNADDDVSMRSAVMMATDEKDAKIAELTSMVAMLRDECDRNASYGFIARQACGVLDAICASICSISSTEDEEEAPMVARMQERLKCFACDSDDYGNGVSEQESARVAEAVTTVSLLFEGFVHHVPTLLARNAELEGLLDDARKSQAVIQLELDHMTQRYEQRGEKLQEGSAAFRSMVAEHEKLIAYSKETEALNHALEDAAVKEKSLMDEQLRRQDIFFNALRERNIQCAKQLEAKHAECVLASSDRAALTQYNIRLHEMVTSLQQENTDIKRKLMEWSRSLRLPTPDDVKHMTKRAHVKRAYAQLAAKHEISQMETGTVQQMFLAETRRIEAECAEKETRFLEQHAQRMVEVERRETRMEKERASLGEERRKLEAEVESMSSEVTVLRAKLEAATSEAALARRIFVQNNTSDETKFCADIALQLVEAMCRGASSSSSSNSAAQAANKVHEVLSTMSLKKANSRLAKRKKNGDGEAADDVDDHYKIAYACLRDHVVPLMDYAKRLRFSSSSGARKDHEGLVILGKLCVDLLPSMMSVFQGCCKGSWRKGVEHDWIKEKVADIDQLCVKIVAAYKSESIAAGDATKLRMYMMQEMPSTKDPPPPNSSVRDSGGGGGGDGNNNNNNTPPPPRRHRLAPWVSFHASTCMEVNDRYAELVKGQTQKALEQMQTLSSRLWETTSARIEELIGSITSDPAVSPVITAEGGEMLKHWDDELKALDARVSLVVVEALVPLDIKHMVTLYQSAWKFVMSLVDKLRADYQPPAPPPPPPMQISSTATMAPSASPTWDPWIHHRGQQQQQKKN